MLEKIKNIFGFSRMPFTKEVPTREMFLTLSMKEACARFEAAVESEDMGLLCGSAGSGKSCILRKFSSTLDENKFKSIYISGENSRIGDIVKQILFLMNEPIPFHQAKAIRNLKSAVEKINSNLSIKPVVILDEAQELPEGTLSGLKALLNYKMDSANSLFILLCGQPELQNKLRLNSLSSLKRRIRIQYNTDKLSLEETSQFIRHQLLISGREKQIISDEAVAVIFDHSKGNIAEVNRLCFSALILAGTMGKEIIDPGMIEGLRSREN